MPVMYIYIESHCVTCAESRRLAAALARLAPTLTIELVDIDQPGANVPSEVFATPTYLLDGQVIALGNPTLERLQQIVGAAGVPVVEDAVESEE